MPTTSTATPIDVSRKFVRLIARRSDGLIEFEFAIGEPELCAELLLPAAAYDAFCQRNAVTELPAREPVDDAEDEAAAWNWSLHQATQQRFR